jgi:hypothetical protein
MGAEIQRNQATVLQDGLNDPHETRRLKLRFLIDAINLDGPKHKLVIEGGISLEVADDIEVGYRNFLLMNALYPESGIVPTKRVDSLWHHHILDTAAYAEDCERVFGRFLHHFPYFGLRGEEDARQLAKAFDETRRAFLAELGSDPAQPSCVAHCKPFPNPV